MRLLMAPFFWLGRVTLWIVFLPLGIWRSIVHHQKKRDRNLIRELDKRR